VTEAEPRVLYVDDDEGLRRLVSRALIRRGYHVSTASSADEALALIAAERFDLIASDHYMPGKDGMAIVEALRTELDPPPLIYVTGSDESRIAVAALKAGAADYVVKTTGEEFYELLDKACRQALDQVRLRREKLQAEEALKAANQALEAVVQRQQVLLDEVNHRVANSLQLVSALIQMQANAVTDPAAKGALIDTQARLKAIIQVHKRLYTSDDVEAVDIEEYLAILLQELEQTWSTREGARSLRLIADKVRLHPDKAVSLGVIVSELVTNACKYAYPPNRTGEVRVSLKRTDDGEVELAVEDDGPGFAPDGAPVGTGLGQKVIRAMAASLTSAVRFDPHHRGVRAVLQFPA
jgi:two-component sensor histidine kinase